MTTTAPIAPAPISVRLVVDTSAALRAGLTRAGEAAVAVTPEWLASLTSEEREALASRQGNLRHVDRGADALPVREATLDEARRILAECVAHEARRHVAREAERERERARDAADAAAAEVARQTLAAHLAQWAGTPASAVDMRAVLDRVGEAALTVSESARGSAWRLPEWDAVRDLIRARDIAEAQAAGLALIEESLAGVEAGTLEWDGRTARAYVIIETRDGVEHVTVREDHRSGHVERVLADVVADEDHPLRERVLMVRATADGQVRAAIAAHAKAIGASELLAQWDAGRLSAERARGIVALAALDFVPVLARVGASMSCTVYPAVPRVYSGAVAPEAWRRWLEARDRAVRVNWANVVAYPCDATTVAVVAIVGGHPYVARMDTATECDEPGCESCCD